jgi:hypothetical protein
MPTLETYNVDKIFSKKQTNKRTKSLLKNWHFQIAYSCLFVLVTDDQNNHYNTKYIQTNNCQNKVKLCYNEF